MGEGSSTPGPAIPLMRLSGDELAGVTDLFGALRRSELTQAVRELSFRRGAEFDQEAHERAIEEAVTSYRLVPVTDPDAQDATLLVAGPTAFPSLPDQAEDLPHILEVPRRQIDREAAGDEIEARLRGEAARAVDRGDDERMATLLDVTYDLEAWAPVDVGPARDRLAAELEGG